MHSSEIIYIVKGKQKARISVYNTNLINNDSVGVNKSTNPHIST